MESNKLVIPAFGQGAVSTPLKVGAGTPNDSARPKTHSGLVHAPGGNASTATNLLSATNKPTKAPTVDLTATSAHQPDKKAAHEYSLGKTIGYGSYAKVKKALHLRSGREVSFILVSI